MRRDVLEYDDRPPVPFPAPPLDLSDVEALRLLLGGGSVVDWQQAAFPDLEAVDRFLGTLLLDMADPTDRERLRYVYNEAVSYLEEAMRLRYPKDLRDPGDVREVFLVASQTGGFRRRQILACAALKLMHVIHHMEAADLKFKAPISEARIFDLAEARVLRVARRMREAGLPVRSFYGSRKSRSSVISKLIAKKESVAATIFDKLRFRVVVHREEDLVPTLQWLVRHALPFNYVIPGQSHNNLLHPDAIVTSLTSAVRDALQESPDAPKKQETVKNSFSGSSYRTINFIADFPVRLPEGVPGAFTFELGRVVFVMVEFQLVDEATAAANESGENAHHLYKGRQHREVSRRLKRGGLQRLGEAKE